uniref:Uncharacterized protein n=1 Tax=Anguilla anguilla TaxID=7936 RepID=A0A0E9T238_ANGAN
MYAVALIMHFYHKVMSEIAI